jgi:protein TonB
MDLARFRPVSLGVALSVTSALLAQDTAPGTTDYDSPPVAVKQKRPRYPDKAFRAGIEGTVVVEFTVDVTGKPTNLKVIKSVPQLDEAAVETVKKWKFKPATKGGKPVAVVAHAPVGFRIGSPPTERAP